MPRVNLTSEQFRLAANGKVFSVTNLSVDGMGIRVIDRNDLMLFPVAAELKGTINLRGTKYQVSARVRHIAGDQVGCEFESLDDSVKTVFQRFLDPAVLGSELKPIPSSENGVLWYHGPSGTDLLLWRMTDGQFRKLALFVLGCFVQWEADVGLSTGCAANSDEVSEARGIFRVETMLLSPDSTPDQGKLNIAKTVILSSNLSRDLKKFFVRRLDSASS
jgi:hypothetical protein